jgi:hypothetical protein
MAAGAFNKQQGPVTGSLFIKNKNVKRKIHFLPAGNGFYLASV